MTEKKTSEAQIRATRNWEKKNPEKARKASYRRSGRNYILNYADEDDLKEVEGWIEERRKNL